MNTYSIKVERLEDGVKQYCLFDEKAKKVIARYGTKREAEEVLIRYLDAVSRLA
jgi:hypothetical protein